MTIDESKNMKIFRDVIKSTIDTFPKIDRFGVIGFIGSMNYKHDIDILFCPSENTKPSEFITAEVELLEILAKKFEKKSKSRLICFTYVNFQEEIEFISKRTHGDLLLHVCNLYSNFEMRMEKKFVKAIRDVLYGSKKAVEKIKKPKNMFYFDYLEHMMLFSAHYPLELLNEKIKHRIGLIYEHFLGMESDLKHSKKIYSIDELKTLYFDCLKKLDE